MNISLKEIYNREAFENLFDINVKKFSDIMVDNHFFIKPQDTNYSCVDSNAKILKDLIDSNKNAAIYVFPENEVENAVNSLEANKDYLKYNFDKFKKINNFNEISNLNNQIVKVNITNIPENLQDKKIFLNVDFKINISQSNYSASYEGNANVDVNKDKINKFDCDTIKTIGKRHNEQYASIDFKSLSDFNNFIEIFINDNVEIDFSKDAKMNLHLDIKNNFYNSSLDLSGKFNSESSELLIEKLNIETKDIETNENFSKKLENLNLFDESSLMIFDNLIDNFCTLNLFNYTDNYYY